MTSPRVVRDIARSLQLLHHAWNGRFRRRGGDHHQQLLLEASHDIEQADTTEPAYHAEDDKHKEGQRKPCGSYEHAQSVKRANPEAADRESECAEGADGSGHHDDVDHSEDQAYAALHSPANGNARFAEPHHGRADHQRDDEHLQHIVVHEGAEQVLGNHREQELGQRLSVGSCIMRGRGRLRCRRPLDGGAKINHIADDCAHQEREWW